MKWMRHVGGWFIAGLLTLLVGGLARADGTTSVTVQPLAPRAGDLITVKGDGLGANREVEVRVIGLGVNVDLGEVRADGAGDFTAQFRLPAELAVGVYQLRAAGAESATTELRVLGAGSEGAMSAMGSIAVRERPLGESIGLVALFGVLAGLGLFLARSARVPQTR